MSNQIITALEVLFTTNTTAVDKAAKDVQAKAEKIEKKPVETKVTADTSNALAGMDRVEDEAKKIVSAKTMATVDANIDAATKNLKSLERERDQIVAAKAKMEIGVDADTKTAAEAGDDTGAAFGKGLIDSLSSIPIAGAVAGVIAVTAAAAVAAFHDGLQQEKSRDRLQALTGIDETAARRLANAAAEAYASSFGESIEQNMDIARTAVQFDLIDPDASTRDAQRVIEGLSGIADVLGEDVQPIARATTQAIRTGLVKSADEFFDVLAAGAREGVNISEDLLDTFTEYPTHFRDLGLSAEEALGLLNQGLKGGARDSDKVADSLKELTIRVKDVNDEAAKDALKKLGLDAREMSRAFAEGGPAARDGLEKILTGLNQVEDESARSQLAVALFGTQAEDMAQALGHLDLSTAVAQLGGVQGAAKRMFDTLSDNDATRVERAFRNIEVATDGMKGALAVAFSEPLGDLADWVSANRGPLLEFFSDLVNGAIDFAIGATSSFGSFVSGPLAAMIKGLNDLHAFLNWGIRSTELTQLEDDMRSFSDVTEVGVEQLELMRGKINDFSDGQIALGYVHDAALRTANAIADVGYGADGAKLSLDGLDVANLNASASGRQLAEQVQATIAALDEEIAAAAAAGESQDDLTGRYDTTADALRDQLIAMGLTKEQAQNLIDTYARVPGAVATNIAAPGAVESRLRVDELNARIAALPAERQTEIRALLDAGDVKAAEAKLVDLTKTRTVQINTKMSGGSGSSRQLMQHDGGLVEFMAGGGLRGSGLNPMQPIAQMVPPNTWRVVGDRGDVPEAYIPLDGSARSLAILMETIRRFPGLALAAGALVDYQPQATATAVSGVPAVSITNYGVDAAELAARQQAQLEHWLATLATPRR